MFRTTVRNPAANASSHVPAIVGTTIASGRGDRTFTNLVRGLYLTSICALVAFLVRGWDYYTTPFSQRPFHADYGWLRPAGMAGQGFGVLGTVLILLLLLYSARKRSRTLARFGSMKQWLALHIYCGITGPLLIVLHSSFKVTGLVAVSFWAMVAVAVSGVLGRYLYTQIPRTVLGHAVAPDEARRQETELDRVLRDRFGADGPFLSRLESLASGRALSAWPILTVFHGMLSDAWLRPAVTRLLRAWSPPMKTEEASVLRRIALEKVRLHRRLHRLEQYQTVFHYWHVIHKPFAVVMILIMGVHIAVAVALGYTWIF